MPSIKMSNNYRYIAARGILLLLQIVGLAPLTIKKPSNWRQLKIHESFKFAVSPIGGAYNLGLIFFFLALHILSPSMTYNVDYINKSDVTTKLEIISLIFGNIVVTMIWLTFAFRGKKAEKFWNRLLSVEGSNKIINDSNNRFITCLALTNIVMWIALIVTGKIAYGYASSDTQALVVIPPIILCWFVFEYIVTIRLIGNRFRAVNEAFFVRPISSFDSHESSDKRIIAENVKFAKIATLRQAFINLCEISSDVSKFYSILILLTIAHSCFLFVFNAYFAIIPFLTAMSPPSIVTNINTLLWLITQILPIIVLASSVNNTTGEARKTAHIVRKLLLSSNSRGGDNDELRLFMLELMHRKVEFSACGWFTLDVTIVHSIFSMAFTYLVILVQFQMKKSQRQESHDTNVPI